jgi:hypothetical protein
MARNVTPDQQESLDKLKEFVDFAYSELAKVHGFHYFKRKKSVLLPMYVNACDLASSVLILLEKERVNSAHNLARSLQETWINARFIFIDKDYAWVDSYLLESELDMKKFVTGAKQIRKKYPNSDTSLETFDDVRLSEIEARANKFVDYVKNKYQTLPVIPFVDVKELHKRPYSLRDKTKIIDHVLSQRISPKELTHTDEWQYLMVYKYLSGGTHVGSSYLATNVLRKDGTATTITMYGDINGIQLVAWTAYALLYDITELFYKQFGYSNPGILRSYRKTMKTLAKKIP